MVFMDWNATYGSTEKMSIHPKLIFGSNTILLKIPVKKYTDRLILKCIGKANKTRQKTPKHFLKE